MVSPVNTIKFVELVTNNLSDDIWFILTFVMNMFQLESKNKWLLCNRSNIGTQMLGFVWEMQSLSDSG